MKNTVFYSWQSDLPNSSNRGFIESSIRQAVKELKSLGKFSIEFNIDRDTKNEPGTPDITESLFKKIDRTKIFIADISIINHTSTDRKTPNPNVLIELGYAAKALGWEKIICIYNTDFGTLEDLPFDLRQRRPILYSLQDTKKTTVRTYISQAIVSSIYNLHNSGSLFDSINDYLKVQVDTEILTIINHLRKIIWGYSESNSLELINKFMNLTDNQIKESLKSSTFIGFQIFKKLEVNERNLQNIVDKAISSPHHGKVIAAVIIDLIRWTGGFDNFNRSRTNPTLFISTRQAESKYKVVTGLQINPRNTEFPDRFILLKKIDEQHGSVEDFGDFIERDKIEGLTNLYTLSLEYVSSYLDQIRQFIEIGKRWLDLTNGEFIIENNKMFEIKINSSRVPTTTQK